MSDSMPKRRWFAYSLRTMFVVVAVFALWLGREAKFVRDRKAWIGANKTLIRRGEPVPVGSVRGAGIYSYPTNSYFPFWRRWLGDTPVPNIVLPEGWTTHDSVKRLFPEAELFQDATFQP